MLTHSGFGLDAHRLGTPGPYQLDLPCNTTGFPTSGPTDTQPTDTQPGRQESGQTGAMLD